MLYPYELGQSVTASPALFEVTRPPAITSRNVAATATQAKEFVHARPGGRGPRRAPSAAPTAASSADRAIDPGTQIAADGRTPFVRSAADRKLPSTSKLRRPVIAPAIRPAPIPRDVRDPAT